uniref:C-Jun-amino-terminal kinase-interacting protein 4 n=1 Tax=Fundulus heteroclitus TaxID=8078 RepID=A0A3Q2PNQ8_FUNHE
MRGREKERELRERDLEKKARQQADQVALEEQKANLSRELSTLRNTHNKKAIDIAVKPATDPFVVKIISSTPELTQFHSCVKAEVQVEEVKGDETEEKNHKEEEREDDADEDDSMEWDLRNTDSVFSELSELSRDYLESVDQGASIRSTDQFEEILAQFEELKVLELVEAARKALIYRVVELTDDRSALTLEVATLQETVAHVEGRLKEKEEEIKLRRELETCQPEDPDLQAGLPTSMRPFSRSEMARVVMEKNQYKQRLFELQEALRHSQALFNRLFGLSKEPLVPPPTSASVLPASSSHNRSPQGSPQQPTIGKTQARRELYRDIRSHVWGTLGKRQIHGWSLPLPVPEPKDVPVLVQLRLLDQRDSTAKLQLNCGVSVTPEISGEATCSVWVVSGPASCSEITVIDPARSNTVLDQFSLPPTAPALCICAVPPITVWIGTQEGILIHPASAGRRRCVQSVCLSEGVHSLYSNNQVIAGLADGTLAFFSHTSGWNLQSHSVMPLGVNPLQPIRCCLVKGARLWVGYWNKVHIVDTENKKQVFSVSERTEQQVRFLCAGGSGVWTSCRLDPIIRLFDWSTGRPLQEVDFTSLVTKTLQPYLTLSPLQISSLSIISGRLWVGTGGGAIFSIPLSISEDISIPYCSAASVQLSYHGHRQAVRFLIAAPTTAQLILSGGEGYINFRIDDASDESTEASQTTPQRSERSHMIIWQIPAPSVPSPAL